MKCEAVYAFIALAGLNGMAFGQERARLPEGPSPVFVTVAQVDKASGELTYLEIVSTPVTVAVTFKKGDEEHVREEVILRRDLRLVKVQLDDVQAFDAESNKLTAEAVSRRLVAGMTVLVSADGKQVEPLYLQMLKKDTLILLAPLRDLGGNGGALVPGRKGPGRSPPSPPQSGTSVGGLSPVNRPV